MSPRTYRSIGYVGILVVDAVAGFFLWQIADSVFVTIVTMLVVATAQLAILELLVTELPKFQREENNRRKQ